MADPKRGFWGIAQYAFLWNNHDQFQKSTTVPAKDSSTKSISELWIGFNKMVVAGNPFNYQTLEWHQWETLFNSLRDDLLECCKKVPDLGIQGKYGGAYTEFSICNGRIVPLYKNKFGSTVPEHRKESAFTANEMSSAYAFMAWELGQREKEQPQESEVAP